MDHRPGRRWSRRGDAWATASSTGGRPCCGATTWPSCNSASAPSDSTPGGSTGSSGISPRRPSASSSAMPACRSTGCRRRHGFRAARIRVPSHDSELVSLGPGPRALPAKRPAPWPAGGWPSVKRAARCHGRRASPATGQNGAVVTTHHHPGRIRSRPPRPSRRGRGLHRTAGRRGRAMCSAAYYAGYRYSSPGGRRLAELLSSAPVGTLDVPDGGSHGMSLPLLRETRMPAVITEIGPAAVVVERGAGDRPDRGRVTGRVGRHRLGLTVRSAIGGLAPHRAR